MKRFEADVLALGDALRARGEKRQDLRLFNDAKVGQREVAGDAKDLARAVRLQRMQQRFCEIHGGHRMSEWG